MTKKIILGTAALLLSANAFAFEPGYLCQIRMSQAADRAFSDDLRFTVSVYGFSKYIWDKQDRWTENESDNVGSETMSVGIPLEPPYYRSIHKYCNIANYL